jgi:PAS domain S-box-containing protein
MNNQKENRSRFLRELVEPENTNQVPLFGSNGKSDKENIYQQMIEESPSGILLMDLNFTIIFVNSQLQKMFLYNREELLGNPLCFIFPGHLTSELENFVQSCVTGLAVSESKMCELVGLRKDNAEIPMEISLKPIHTPNGLNIYCCINDITPRQKTEAKRNKIYSDLQRRVEKRTRELVKTNRLLRAEIEERKRTEGALKNSEQRYRTIVHTATEGIWILNSKNETTFVNNTMAELLEYSIEELRAKSLYDFLVGESSKIAKEYLINRFFDFNEQHYFKFRKKSGAEVWTVLSVKKIEEKNGKYVGAMVLVTDITERKKAEAEIRKLSSAVEQSAGIIIITDNNGKIEYINPKFTEVTGFTRDEVDGKNPNILKGGKTPPEVYQDLWSTITKGKEWRGELHNKKKNNESYWALVSISPIKNADGSITHFLGVQEDITERKIADDALKRYSKELERSNEELQQFAYVASHDLQEPLRMVNSYMTLIKRRYNGKLDKDGDEFIGYAVDGAKRMKQLINDLLLYSRVGTHGKPFVRTNCNKVLEKTFQNLQLAIAENQIEITLDKLPVVMADETQLLQLFQNLISNAIKFRGKKTPKIHISSKEKEGNWIFSVSDNGIGIDKEFMDRIFIIFQRLHPISKYPGTGIGLAVCKKIVERHGGKIWIESDPRSGSTFFFSIPKTIENKEN